MVQSETSNHDPDDHAKSGLTRPLMVADATDSLVGEAKTVSAAVVTAHT